MSVTKVASGRGSVLVGGASGFIGRSLTKALKSKGYDVKIVGRDVDTDDNVKNFTWRDIRDNGMPYGLTAAINLAGQNMFDPSQKWQLLKSTIWTSRVGTTRIMKMAIDDLPESEKPKVFIGMSGVGYYAPSATEEYTEDSFGGFADYLGQLAKAWEAETRLIRSDKVRRVVLRSGVVLGKGGGIIQQMYWPFFLGVGGPVGRGDQYFPWIHVVDLVELMIFAIENEHVQGILNGVAPQIITNKEFAKALGSSMGRPSFIPVPKFFLKAMFSEERAMIMTEGQRVIPKRTLETGFKFKYDNIDDACSNL